MTQVSKQADNSLDERDSVPRRLDQQILCELQAFFSPSNDYIHLSYFKLFWIFVTGSIFGLVVETFFHFIVFGGYESRAGLVWGPFSPIYGVGAVVLTIFLNKFYHSHNIVIFIVAMVLGSCIEFITSWLMETLFGAVAWDYTGTFGSIGGRTNFAFGVMWGLLGLVWMRIIMPFVKSAFEHINQRTTWIRILTIVMSVLLLIDISVTLLALERQAERAMDIPATNFEQQFFDEYFSDSYMNAIMHNTSVYGRK